MTSLSAPAPLASDAASRGSRAPRRLPWAQALAALAAQVGAETHTRLRSAGTIVTVLVLFAAAFAYVPPPESNRVSIMWSAGGEQVSGIYSSGFIGAVVGMLTAMLLPFVGFYLVTGSVRRDLARRVWPIIAATPTSTTSYLLGKWLASAAYLLVLASLGLVPALVLFAQYGTGPFSLAELLLPWALLVPPSMLFTASMALLFDVTPVLRGRGGYVVWFFAWAFLFMAIPGNLGRMLDQDRTNDRLTTFDPAGVVLFDHLVGGSMAAPVESVSMGIVILDEPVRRVPFPPLRLDATLLGTRIASAAWSAAPLLAAIGLFGLARRTGVRPPRRRRRDVAPQVAPQVAPNGALAAAALEPVPAAPVALRAHATRPGFARSVVAELIVTWHGASWLKWGMLAVGLATLVAPGDSLPMVTAVFLLLLAPPIAEAAAREELAGTSAVAFAQPGVPRSVVAWKVAAVGLFVFLAAAPVLVASFTRSLDHGLALMLALTFVATSAVGCGFLTGGGKLFLGAYTALWYVAIQRDSPLDFTGAVATPDLSRGLKFVGVGLLAVAGAAVMERLRARRG